MALECGNKKDTVIYGRSEEGSLLFFRQLAPAKLSFATC